MRHIIPFLIPAAHLSVASLAYGQAGETGSPASNPSAAAPAVAPPTLPSATSAAAEQSVGQSPAVPAPAPAAPAPAPSPVTPSLAPSSPTGSTSNAPPTPPGAPQEDTSPTRLPESSAPAPEAPTDKPPPPAADVITKAQFGKGILLGTANESFTLNIRARMQLQALYYDAHEGSSADLTQIQVRRARMLLQGNVYGPELTYYIQLAFSNRDTEPDARLPLRDAYFTYAPHPSTNLRFGQMKVPYGRQRVVSSSAQGMVDRSIVTTELNLDRDVGVQLFSKDLFGLGETLGYAVGVFGGDGRNRLATNAGYLYVGRLSFTPFGGFDEFVEADIGRDPRPRLAIAAGAAYNQATNRPQSTIGSPYSDPTVFFDYTHFGVDFSFKWHGFFATGEWMLRQANARAIGIDDGTGATTSFASREAWGGYVQVGQMLTDELELSARLGHLNPLRETDPKLSLTQEVGGGVSYYFEEHNLKVQSDYFYYARNSDFEAGDHQIRIQSQLFF